MQELTLRGMGVGVVGMYVEDLGGQLVAERGGRVYAGPGWQIELVEGEAVRVGAVQLGVTLVRIEGSESTVAQVGAALSRKVLRAGG